jgi:hypothetical protein
MVTGYTVFDERFFYLFNSYYVQARARIRHRLDLLVLRRERRGAALGLVADVAERRDPGAALAGGPAGPVDGGCEPDQVAPRAHDLVLRAVPAPAGRVTRPRLIRGARGPACT